MRFLFVDASRNGWGTEQHCVCLAGALKRAGHSVAAVVKRGSPVERMLADSDLPVYSTPFRGGADPRGLLTVARAIREHAPDWLVANRSKLYWPLWLMGRASGVRVALFRHLPYIRNWSRRCLLPLAVDRFFVVSEFARAVLAAQGAPIARLRVLYNPIDLRRFRPDIEARGRVRRALGLAPDAVLAGFVGRIERSKGVIELSDALASLLPQLPRLNFLWVGEGRERAGLQSRSGAGQRQRFVGWMPDVERFYAALDFLVAPGIQEETFGRVVAEAQACGVPVIVSGAGGLKEAFLPGRTGLLVDPESAVELQHAIVALYQDATLRAQFGAAGREWVGQRFAAERVVARFIDCLEETSDSIAAPDSGMAALSRVRRR